MNAMMKGRTFDKEKTKPNKTTIVAAVVLKVISGILNMDHFPDALHNPQFQFTLSN